MTVASTSVSKLDLIVEQGVTFSKTLQFHENVKTPITVTSDTFTFTAYYASGVQAFEKVLVTNTNTVKIILTETEKDLVRCNKAFYELFQLKAGQTISQKIAEGIIQIT